MPYYCTVPRCTSMAGKAKNVSFHQFPRDEDLARLWNEILKRGKPYTKYSKVCSLHFRPEDYTITSVGKNKGQWRTLRKDAIPSRNLPSEVPTTSHQRVGPTGGWPNAPVIDAQMQQQVAQAIYLQTMLAMQAANNGTPFPIQNFDSSQQLTKIPPHEAKLSEIEKILLKNNTNLTINPFNDSNDSKTIENHNPPDQTTKKASYKCEQCSKCFKDPDVFTLHQRIHANVPQEVQEKENVDSNDVASKETLRANPILANLLKTDVSKLPDLSSSFDRNSILHLENQLLTALNANLQSYISNFTKTQTDDSKSDTERNDDKNNVTSTNFNSESNLTVNCKVNNSDDDHSTKPSPVYLQNNFDSDESNELENRTDIDDVEMSDSQTVNVSNQDADETLKDDQNFLHDYNSQNSEPDAINDDPMSTNTQGHNDISNNTAPYITEDSCNSPNDDYNSTDDEDRKENCGTLESADDKFYNSHNYAIQSNAKLYKSSNCDHNLQNCELSESHNDLGSSKSYISEEDATKSHNNHNYDHELNQSDKCDKNSSEDCRLNFGSHEDAYNSRVSESFYRNTDSDLNINEECPKSKTPDIWKPCDRIEDLTDSKHSDLLIGENA